MSLGAILLSIISAKPISHSLSDKAPWISQKGVILTQTTRRKTSALS